MGFHSLPCLFLIQSCPSRGKHSPNLHQTSDNQLKTPCLTVNSLSQAPGTKDLTSPYLAIFITELQHIRISLCLARLDSFLIYM
ncbi:hypothetical protein L6452_32694 [Arctium lappa]|uniref:Uncharacterized protein n=1 Tax=Arctium lappa TaxID=4217 RepID=A0ACB8Z5C7_ARCLA|nr:hypothetical protein L6452_32694 [Arctium lappa]